MKNPANRSALKIGLLYGFFAGLWIILSDRLLSLLVANADLETRLQTPKGWFFVLFTALILYLLLKREFQIRYRAEASLSASYEEVRLGREQLRTLAGQIVTAQEEERRRLSRELHDEAGQALTALSISLELIQAEVPAPDENLHARLGEAISLTHTTMDQIRLLAQDLRPPALDTLGLGPTLKGFCRDFARRTGLEIDYSIPDELPALPDTHNIALYRFLQEALNNVVKHAEAARAWVTLSCEPAAVSLAVEDDGQGFGAAGRTRPAPAGGTARSGGIGLLGMQERIRLLGGSLEIESRPGHGTRIVAQLQS